MLETPKFVLEKIREVRQQGLKELDLSYDWTIEGNQLIEFPPEIFELKNLEVLKLKGNQIGSIPESISQLRHLTALDLSNTGIANVPKAISKLQRLESLDLSSNPFEEFPDSITGLRNLASLNLGYGKLTTLPESISKLQKLATLDLSSNRFTTFPESVTNLQNLANLDVGFNELRSLPESIAKLQNLTTLRVTGNTLLTFPGSITELQSLTSLDLAYLGVPFPEALAKLQNLTSLRLTGNELTSFPESITDLQSLSFLDLASTGLATLPESISKLQNLTSLNLGGNTLTELPQPVTKLEKLTSLDLGSTGITTLPDSFIGLQNLTHLDMSSNGLTSVPAQIIELEKLDYLNLAINELSDLPESITKLSNLSELILGGNKFTTIPDCVFDMSHLSNLWLVGNFLTNIPASITRLKNLKTLALASNNLTFIPDAVYELRSLERLDLSNFGSGEKNQIKELSPKILQLENLEALSLADNPIEVPPPEIVEQRVGAIKNYFRQLEAEGEDYLYEAKLLIVGEGGAGKTSLANKIRNAKYELQEEDSTKGIEVIPWMFPMDNGKSFRVNIWDFGGQEIYHATHQFFLTKRSLYVLVADTRKEDTDFYYWLNAVELFSDNSPLLIVKNEKQDRHREINERHLRGQFSNLKETMATNLATNRGLEKISDEIKHYISHLPQVGAPLPKTWVKVREALEKDIRNYISLDQYLDICEANGFSKLKDKVQLSGYLHDLGVCLYFQEDPLLRKTIILKPRWGTDAVYKVLDNKEVIGNLGKFNRKDLADIWNEPEYANMQDELLQLMINFKLCYRIPNSENYIAPQLLSENQPNYEWDETNNLILRYKYDSFMPKGMLTQFIVAMNKLIAGQKVVWRSGVVLEKGRTRAEVVEYYGQREIKIRVAGKDRKELLTIATYELDRLHESYQRLKFSKLIPCNCDVCKSNQDPHFYAFEVLKRFIGDNQQRIQCEKSYQMVDVRGLIDDVAGMKQLLDDRVSPGRDFIFQGTVENLVIQQTERGTNVMESKDTGTIKVKSAWANGSFYLFTFAVVIAGLGVLARSVPGFALAGILTAGVIFVPLIGALQLRQDDRLSEKSFIELMKMVIGQLPLIGKLFGRRQESQ